MVDERNRNSLPILPAPYHPISRVIGIAKTLRLAREFGGEKVEFPARPRSGSRLMEAIGAKAIALLHRQYGRDRVKLPTAWPYLNLLEARKLRRQGRTMREIALRLRIARSTAEHYCTGVEVVTAPKNEREVAKAAPLPLFPGA
ncbi:hypothetical protein [Niveispirillum sp. KHB5.9]|uniref:hypothetical protein n=1 Tax=Niveispirillum sp. KHB5.9 TaxID=3400269 RepID=UPI003A89B394